MPTTHGATILTASDGHTLSAYEVHPSYDPISAAIAVGRTVEFLVGHGVRP